LLNERVWRRRALTALRECDASAASSPPAALAVLSGLSLHDRSARGGLWSRELLLRHGDRRALHRRA
jgi:hypothetical protein